MATRVTRANPSAAPPPEDHTRKAPSKKIHKTVKKKVAFEVPEMNDDEEQDSDDEGDPKGPPEESRNAPRQTPDPGQQRPNKDLPFKDVPEVAYVPLGKNLRPMRLETPDDDDQGPAFHNRAPLDGLKPENVMSKVLDTPITLTLGDLLKSDKGVREGLKKLLTKKRIPSNE